MSQLYSMGMSRAITMNHSDHWAVAQGLVEMAEQYGQPVIQAINEIVPKTGGKLWSRHDSTYGQVDRIIRRAEELVQEREEERAAKAEAEQKAREEAQQKAQAEAERIARESAENSAPAQTAGNDLFSNPYAIGGALGVGTLVVLLLRG